VLQNQYEQAQYNSESHVRQAPPQNYVNKPGSKKGGRQLNQSMDDGYQAVTDFGG